MDPQPDELPTRECPVAEVAFRGPCPVTKCMYRSGGDCAFATLSVLSSRDKRRHLLAAKGATEKKLAESISTVKAVLVASQFFSHLFQKDITDATRQEIETAASSRDSYLRWLSSPPWTEVQSAFQLLLRELR